MLKRYLSSVFAAVIIGLIALLPQVTLATFGDTTTYVGKIIGGDGKDKLSAYLDQSADFAVDSSGNFYLADTRNNVIRKISSSGTVSTVAGTGAYGDVTGNKSDAKFAGPEALALDGSTIFVADTGNNTIKKISGSTVSTLVSSGLSGPKGLYADTSADILYIADTGNNKIKKVAFGGGSVSTVASGLNAPTKFTKNGGTLYVNNTGDSKIKSVVISSGAVATVASDFLDLGGITYHEGHLYSVDGDGLFDYLQSIDPSTGAKSLLAEDGSMITLNTSSQVLVYNSKIYFLNRGSSSIYRFDLDGSNPVHFAGKDRFGNDNGTGTNALIGAPKDIVISDDRAFMYLAENNKIRKITLDSGKVESLIGNAVDNYKEGRTGSDGRFSDITSIAVSPDGATLYVTDRNNNRVRGIDIAAKIDFLISGAGEINSHGESDNGYQEGTKCLAEFDAGVSGCAYFNRPTGIAISSDGKFLYVTDTGNHRIRRVRVSDGQTTLIAGSGAAGFTNGVGSAAKFNSPYSVTIDAAGDFLYVADKGNHAIRKIDLATREVTTLTGTGSFGYNDATFDKAVFSFPEYIEFGGDGHLYVSEVGSQRIRQLDLENEVTKLVAGSGDRGFLNGNRSDAEFNNPKGMAVDAPSDTIYVTDNQNDLIRKMDIEGEAPFTELSPTVTRVDPNTKTLADRGDQTIPIDLYGSNIRHGAIAYVGAFQALKTYVTDYGAVLELPFGLLDPGHYDITVKNIDSQSYTLLKGFRVTRKDGVLPGTYYKYDGSVVGGDGVAPLSANFFPYDSALRGGFNSSTCDVNKDGVDEIIVGTGVGFGPQVKVFTKSGDLLFSFFGFAETLRAGVRTSCGDLDKDGKPEIVVTAGPGGRPHVRIFDNEGNLKHPGWFALDGKFKGGTYTTIGDVNGDKVGDIIVSAGKGGGPHITVHRMDGRLLATFFAYSNTFRAGIQPVAMDFDNDGRDEIVVVPDTGTSHVQTFSIQPNDIRLLNPGFFAFGTTDANGFNIAGGDIDGDGKDEIIVGTGPNNIARVRVFNKDGSVILKDEQVFSSSYKGGVNVSAGDVDGDGDDDIIVLPRSSGVPDLRVLK